MIRKSAGNKCIKYSLALLILILVLCITSCDTFSGCGPIVAVGSPKVWTKTYNNGTTQYYTYYPVVIEDDNGRRHTVYVSYYTWANAKLGDIICVE